MESKLPIEDLLHEEEGTTLDFKQEQYQFSSASDYQKSEILKDVLAFANAWRRIDAYILIGVEEVKGGRSKVIGIKDELDDARLQQFVNGKTQRPIEFHYSTVLIDEKKIGVIRIPIQTRPFFLEKDYGKLKKHVVYIRRGSSTAEADPAEIFDMGKAEIQESQELPKIVLEFANLESRSSVGSKRAFSATLLAVPPPEEIPDYEEKKNTKPFAIAAIRFDHPNRDYFRELVNYYDLSSRSNELAFVLRNESTKAISDIRVELIAQKKNNAFTFFKSEQFPVLPRQRNDFIGDIKPLAATCPLFQ